MIQPLAHEFSVRSNWDACSPRIPGGILEPHFSPQEIAEAWGLSVDKVRDLFKDENGIVVIENPRLACSRRRYRTFRIPQSVAERVHRRLTRVV